MGAKLWTGRDSNPYLLDATEVRSPLRYQPISGEGGIRTLGGA